MGALGRCLACASLLVAGSGRVAAGDATPPPDVCPNAGDAAVTVAAVEPRLDLRLADGRRLRLVGLDPAEATPRDPALADTARARLAAILAGRPTRIRVLDARPDRWGRLAAYAFVGDGSGHAPAGGLAADAIGAGLGRWRAEPAAHGCREDFIAAEGKARAGSLGLWRDPYYAVLAAEDGAAFAGRSATTVIAEGRLAAVEASPQRTRLRFAAGDRNRDALVATILPRAAKAFEASRVKLGTLVGRTLRVRGLLDLRFGPHLEITSPDAVEILTKGAPQAPTGAG